MIDSNKLSSLYKLDNFSKMSLDKSIYKSMYRGHFDVMSVKVETSTKTEKDGSLQFVTSIISNNEKLKDIIDSKNINYLIVAKYTAYRPINDYYRLKDNVICDTQTLECVLGLMNRKVETLIIDKEDPNLNLVAKTQYKNNDGKLQDNITYIITCNSEEEFLSKFEEFKEKKDINIIMEVPLNKLERIMNICLGLGSFKFKLWEHPEKGKIFLYLE